jgi:hypothetical protein
MIMKKRTSATVWSVVLTFILCLYLSRVPELAGQSLEDHVRELTNQVIQLQSVVLELRSEVTRSREELRELRQGLQKAPAIPELYSSQAQQQPGNGDAGMPQEQRLALLEENQRLLSDRLDEQYQTKVESSSRYRTRLSGIVLLNAFANHGRVDNAEAPNLALRRRSADTAGTMGLTALQSEIGFETFGPILAGARTSAGIQFDFSGISASDAYASNWGAVRMRTASVRLDWASTSLIVGQDSPFLSPLSPTSVASLAYPAFSYSGNLWNWIPQARIEQRFGLSESDTISLEGGILDPLPRSSAQPGYATRLAWTHGDPERPLAIGVGGHYSRQNYGAGRKLDGWAVTTDWRIPLGNRLELSGEFFRGRALGNLGAAQGRSVVTNGYQPDPSTSIVGLNSIGGWTQLKFRATSTVEFHAAHGEDVPYRRDLNRFSPNGGYNGAFAKNRTEMINVIYRPRTDLLFSLEYRRLNTSRVSTVGETADHVNLGVGVLF